MTNLEKVLEVFKYKITNGEKHYWSSYPDGWYVDFYEKNVYEASVIISHKNQNVYEATILNDTHAFRWIDPKYKTAYLAESFAKNDDPTIAYDDRKWTDLEVFEDFLNKAHCIVEGKPVDTRIDIILEFDDEELLQIFKRAHAQDITLNQYIEKILLTAIESHVN